MFCEACKAWCALPAWARYRAIKIHFFFLLLNVEIALQAGPGKKLYLISDTYQRTVKYFLCLAANVPTVSHMWIRDSCVQVSHV